MTYDTQLQEAANQLAFMIAKERPNGEFLLASVVQDSLLYSFVSYAESPFLLNIAHNAADITVRTVAECMVLNEFAICESIRGVMHTMLNLGGEPTLMAVAVASGAVGALEQIELSGTHLNTHANAVGNGICSAAADTGLNLSTIQLVFSNVLNHKLISSVPIIKNGFARYQVKLNGLRKCEVSPLGL